MKYLELFNENDLIVDMMADAIDAQKILIQKLEKAGIDTTQEKELLAARQIIFRKFEEKV